MMKNRIFAGFLLFMTILTALPTAAIAAETGHAEALDILFIGNSHTDDTVEYTDIIIKDLKAAGLAADINVEKITVGGRKLFTNDIYTGSHLYADTMSASAWSQWQTQYNAANSGDRAYESYKSRYAPLHQKAYDMVVVQDYLESPFLAKDQFLAGMEQVLSWIREYQPGADIAWLADWVLGNASAAQKAQARENRAAVAALEDAPILVLPVGTAIENGESSYLGQTKNTPDSAAAWDSVKDLAPACDVFRRDNNHLSYELGRYTAGAAAMAKIVTHYGLMSLDNYCAALKTAPVSSPDWVGAFNDNIWGIVKESVQNAIAYPSLTTACSAEFAHDPLDRYDAALRGLDGAAIRQIAVNTGLSVTDAASIISHPDVNSYIANALGTADYLLTGSADSTAGGFTLRLTLAMGYSQKVRVIRGDGNAFMDIQDHWALDEINLAAAHGFVNGITETHYAPEEAMTRAMALTLLARFDGVDTRGGSTWYEKGIAWAVAHNISDGSNPTGRVTREDLITALWRYAGRPAVSASLADFTDQEAISSHAKAAMQWAVGTGLVGGADGRLDSKGDATRAEVAALLIRFSEGQIQ